MSKLILPSTTEDGRPKLSYSQHNLWNEAKGFNTGLIPGKYEYIRKYFMWEKYEDIGWGQFGNETQQYIQQRLHKNNFSAEEKKVLDTIEPLDIFEKEFIIDFGDFVVQAFLDDISEDHALVRDYKTASDNSRQKYYEDSYDQLDVYALAIYKEKGFIPNAELIIIEREGNAYKGGRKVLKVGKNVWTHEIKMNKQKLNNIEKAMRKTAKEISEYYKVYLKMTGE